MNDRVSTNRPSTPTPATSGSRSSSAPTESPGLDQAAAEFASMLGSEDQARTEDRRDFGGTDVREVESPRSENDRVERQSERRDDDSQGDSDGQEGNPEGEPAPDVFALGDLILQGMTQKTGAQGAAAADAAAFGAMQMENIVQQVADRILVSPPGAGGQEVRITIKDSILPGTEVRITQNGGQLQISLVTNDARSHELLAQHQAALQERLTEKLGKHEVAVKVEMDSGGQPDRDGQSRNQRDIESELRENAE
jgi:type III secretion system needle length determinant